MTALGEMEKVRLPLESVEKIISEKESRRKVFNVVLDLTLQTMGGKVEFDVDEDRGD